MEERGEIPHGFLHIPIRTSRLYSQGMKTNPVEKWLTFGELVATVYSACGKRKARGILQLALLARVVAFRGRNRFVIA